MDRQRIRSAVRRNTMSKKIDNPDGSHTRPTRSKESLGPLSLSARSFLAGADSRNCAFEDLLDYFPQACDELQTECKDSIEEIAKLLADDPGSKGIARKIGKDSHVSWRVPVDKMTLYILEPAVGQGRSLCLSDVLEQLRAHGITENINAQAVPFGGRPFGVRRRVMKVRIPGALGSGWPKKNPVGRTRVAMGGEGFEPSKAYANRFTVCPLWPLGYPPVRG